MIPVRDIIICDSVYYIHNDRFWLFRITGIAVFRQLIVVIVPGMRENIIYQVAEMFLLPVKIKETFIFYTEIKLMKVMPQQIFVMAARKFCD